MVVDGHPYHHGNPKPIRSRDCFKQISYCTVSTLLLQPADNTECLGSRVYPKSMQLANSSLRSAAACVQIWAKWQETCSAALRDQHSPEERKVFRLFAALTRLGFV